MPMQVLKVFCDLAECRNLSKTAEANGLSQPTVSRSLRKLEKRLGGPLFDRSHRPLRLTDLGAAYYEGCKKLLDQYAQLEASLLRNCTRLSVTVRVAAIYSVGLGDMSRYVKRCETIYPHAKVQIDYLRPDNVYSRVRDGTAELGLISFPDEGRDLTVLPWREEEMVVVCAPTHPLARLGRVKPAQLDGERYIAFGPSLAIRRELDRFLRDRAIAVEVESEFEDVENVKRAIEAGTAVSILPEPMVRRECQAGMLLSLPLDGCHLVRPLGIIHRRQHELCSAALGFIDLLRSD